MPNKHYRLIVEAFATANAFLSALDTSGATTVAQLATQLFAYSLGRQRPAANDPLDVRCRTRSG